MRSITQIYRAFRRWQSDGCFDAIFEASVFRLHCDDRLDTRIIHGDGTTSAAKKGGDNLGFSGHKKVKGCKVLALCDRNCNVIAPFVSAPGNRNESPLLREALPRLTRIVHAVGLELRGSVVSLDGVYGCRRNRKAIFNRGMVPNINPNERKRKNPRRGRKPLFNPAIFAVKRRTRPMLGFKTFRCARILLAGIEIMHMIAKGQMKCARGTHPSATD
ncbi:MULTISPECIES: transposase [Paraburkholderia]|uniref:transposase n=1 Tax=Paraburkholderia TaxID=1822464 RepID=UPI0035E45F85